MPEDKYRVVELLQLDGHMVGMTGDGVNDAPALKKANVGIAVHGATDAARSAASIVLLLPGLHASAFNFTAVPFNELLLWCSCRWHYDLSLHFPAHAFVCAVPHHLHHSLYHLLVLHHCHLG